MIRFSHSVIFLAIGLSFYSLISCRGPVEEPHEENVLMMYGDSILTLSEVERKIPIGISPSDSAALFRKIVDSWIENIVLKKMAEENLPSIDEIEKQVEAYRNRLIISEFLSRMRAKRQAKVSDDSIRKFYDTYRQDMLAERPLIKGLLLKVPQSESGLDEIRQCVFSASENSLDELEKKWGSKILQYDYFASSWIDWQNIADQIPYRFYDPDAFVSSTKNFETSSGGIVYLLHITEYIPSGKELPFEFASSRIRTMLEQAKIARFQEDLVESLVKKALSEGKLEAVGYDPLLHKRKEKEKN